MIILAIVILIVLLVFVFSCCYELDKLIRDNKTAILTGSLAMGMFLLGFFIGLLKVIL